MKSLEVFGGGLLSVDPRITAQRRVNCYFDQRSDGDKDKLIIKGTPGLSLLTSLPTQPVRGQLAIVNWLYVVAGNSLYMVNTFGGYILVDTLQVNGVNLPVDCATPVSMGINETQLIIVDGANRVGWVFPYQLIQPTAAVIIADILAGLAPLIAITKQSGNIP